MCTALTYSPKDHYFGRNLDLDVSYQESVAVTPRNYPFRFRKAPDLPRHHAMIGMAFVVDGYPLYYDAVNEHGLAMAGLYFPGNAVFYEEAENRDNVAPFEFIPWIVGQCETVAQARQLLARMNLWNSPFSQSLPLTPLHWIIADKEETIVVETLADGMHIYNNPVGVLTNNPPFDFMTHYLSLFRDRGPGPSENRFDRKLDLSAFSEGFGGLGLPGDASSPSRFVRAAFVKGNSRCDGSEQQSVSQFFHILGSVEMPRGCVRTERDTHDLTIYSCCCNQDKGIYYYTTYDNRQISAVEMRRENLEGDTVIAYPLCKGDCFHFQN